MATKRTYWHITPAQHDFIVEHQANISRRELTEKFNKEFGLNLKVENVRSYAKRNGLFRKISVMISSEGHQWLVENQAGMGRRELTASYNNRFGTDFSTPQVSHYCNRKGLNADEIIRNRKRIGTITRHDKFLYIKTANPSVWQPLHRVQWESYHGKKIPVGFMITFADGDVDNHARDNLVCVRDSISIVINHCNRADTPDPELNKAIMLTESLRAMVKDNERRMGRKANG